MNSTKFVVFVLAEILLVVIAVIGNNVDEQLLPPAAVVQEEKEMSSSLFDAIRSGNEVHVASFLSLIRGTTMEDAAINLAVKLEQNSIVRLLLQNGASPNGVDARDGGKLPLHHAAENGDNDAVRLLARYGAGVDVGAANTGVTPLISAIMANKFDTVRLMLDLGADVNKTDNFGNSPLHFAIGVANVNLVQLLISREAFVEPKRDINYAASVRNISQRIISALLDKGADVDSQDKVGRSPLYYAVRYGDVQLARLLLQRGANPNLEMNGCNSPIYLAVTLFSGIGIVRTLVDYGASVDKADCTGQTPLEMAQQTQQQQPEVAKLLIDVAESKYAVTGSTVSPLSSCSCCAGHYEVKEPELTMENRIGILHFQYIKDDPDLNLLIFQFNVNKLLPGIHSADFSVPLRPKLLAGSPDSAEVFSYSTEFPLVPGDTVYYWVLAILDKRGFAQLTDQKWTFGPEVDGQRYFPSETGSAPVPTESTATSTAVTTTVTTTTTTTATSSTKTTVKAPKTTRTTTTPYKWNLMRTSAKATTTIRMDPIDEDMYLNLTWFFG